MSGTTSAVLDFSSATSSGRIRLIRRRRKVQQTRPKRRRRRPLVVERTTRCGRRKLDRRFEWKIVVEGDVPTGRGRVVVVSTARGTRDDDERRIAEREGGSLGYEEELFGAVGVHLGAAEEEEEEVEVANGDGEWRREKRVRAVDAEEQQQNEFGEPSNGELNERDFRDRRARITVLFKLTGVFLTTTLIVVSAYATIYTTQCLLFASAVTDAWSYGKSRLERWGIEGKC